MLSFLVFVFVIGSVNGREVFCNFTNDDVKLASSFHTEHIFLGDSSTNFVNHMIWTSISQNSKCNKNIINLKATTDKAVCEPDDYKVSLREINIICQCKMSTCEFTPTGSTIYFRFIESELIEGVDFKVSLENYHLILFYILLFGVFILNISTCIVIKKLRRY